MTALVTPIDRYLAAQQDTTAVERFARRHDADLLAPGDRWYADRLPTTDPGPGEQFAFRVDLDQCTGCKSCVAACHSLNGLDEEESWRSVGQLVSEGSGPAVTQNVPSGCHHCVDPACLSGCPTNAYEKDPFSGIVRHLDDQCIGCSYCELTCPYEVPKMNKRLGVVRKCDMCADRLADGEAPACVQACPTSAITITTVETQRVIAGSVGNVLVPGAPASTLTMPTTQYVGASATEPSLVAADRHALHPSRAHPPLALMLVLTQLSVGAFLTALAADWFAPGSAAPAGPVAAALAGLIALGASVLHLGRPAVAWRAVLGLGHSWLSREIVAFGAYAGLTTGYAVAVTTSAVPRPVAVGLGVAGGLAGVVGVACSALIYIATKRTWWQARRTVGLFVGSATVTGPAFLISVVLVTSLVGDVEGPSRSLAAFALGAALVAATVKLATELAVLRSGRWSEGSDMARTAALLAGPLVEQTRWRVALGVAGGIAGPIVVFASVVADAGSTSPTTATLSVLAFGCVVAGELVERHHFFVASVAPRMPGGFRR